MEKSKWKSLGLQPLANNFLRSKHLSLTQKRYPLNLRICNNCGLVQLKRHISAEKLFSEYNYVPSVSNALVSHFKKGSEDICKVAMMTPGDFVVDIGSNDGLLLKQFQTQSMNVLGIEPAKNIARQANEKGIDTINAFFDSQVVENIMAHVNDLRNFISNIEKLLSHNGVFVAEFPYLVDLVEKKEFDTIYHEHLSYFSMKPLIFLLSKSQLKIFKVKRLDIHGGSIRIYLKKGVVKNCKKIDQLLIIEEEMGLYTKHLYENLFETIKKETEDLRIYH